MRQTAAEIPSTQHKKYRLRFCALLLPMMGIGLGLVFCLLQSPQSQSQRLISAAQMVKEKDPALAATFAAKAVAKNPLSHPVVAAVSPDLLLHPAAVPPSLPEPDYAAAAQFRLSALLLPIATTD